MKKLMAFAAICLALSFSACTKKEAAPEGTAEQPAVEGTTTAPAGDAAAPAPEAEEKKEEAAPAAH